MMRGEIYRAELKPRSGSEQHGRRPVIVVSHDSFNKAPGWRSVIVVPLTTSSRARKGPTSVLLSAGPNGLSEDSFVLCHQITTLDRSKLTKKIGRVSMSEQARIDKGILAAVDLL